MRPTAEIDYDPEAWLQAPLDPAENGAWLAAKTSWLIARLELDPDSPGAEYVRRALRMFVSRDLGQVNKFLRLGQLQTSPLVATVSVRAGVRTDEARSLFEAGRPGAAYYDAGHVVTLDEQRGLRRALRYVVDARGQLAASVWYYREVPEVAGDVFVQADGADTVALPLALPDLDRLASSVWFVAEDGTRS